MRIVIGEDEALLRQGLTHLLRMADHDVVGTAANAVELLRQVEEQQPDLVITDIRMPPHYASEGLEAAQRIADEWPKVAIVVLSQYVQRRAAMDLLARRGSGIGYLLKQRIADISTFCTCIERVQGGETVLDPEVVSLMVSRARRDDRAVDQLTTRQREVLVLLAEGRANIAIAQELSISEKSVVAHVSHIYDALGLAATAHDHRRVLAVIRYLSRDLD
jgi:DNA-binding NarL/FixJ family response regulator